jgi:hypothetical protein
MIQCVKELLEGNLEHIDEFVGMEKSFKFKFDFKTIQDKLDKLKDPLVAENLSKDISKTTDDSPQHYNLTVNIDGTKKDSFLFLDGGHLNLTNNTVQTKNNLSAHDINA